MTSRSYDNFMSAAASQFEQNWPLFPMYLHLLISALLPIYTGAHASLSRPSSAAKSAKSPDDDGDNEEEEQAVQQMEGMTPKDAIVFPLTAGIILAGLYYAIKAYGADMINVVLGVYFSLIGTYSVAKLINDFWSTVQGFIMPAYYRDHGQVWKVVSNERKAIALGKELQAVAHRATPLGGFLGRLPLPAPLRSIAWRLNGMTTQKFVVKGFLQDFTDFRTTLTCHNVISTFLGIAAVVYSFMVDRPWWLTNIQGTAVAYGMLQSALQLISPTTFATGSLILSGLFFYDIWAVFFTPLMVTVAKNLDVPIKLVFPRPSEPSSKPGEPPVQSFSMLGLGDIVLPGLMIGLALRFDLYIFYLRKQKKVRRSGDDGSTEEVEKAPYVPITGHWGEKLWTAGAARSSESSLLPAFLTSSFPKTYFTATLIGYVVGMLATLVFMSIFQHAQPALLYLVPSVLVSLWGTGLVRGDLNDMWNFTEAITAEPIEDKRSDTNEVSSQEEPEPKSTFSYLWAEIFGEDAPKQEKSKAGKTNSEEQSTKKSDSGVTDSNGIEKDMLFSFTVAHHKKKVGSDTETQQQHDDHVPEAGVNLQEGTTSSEPIPDDTIMVSSADL